MYTHSPQREMTMYIQARPISPVDTIPIEVAIRLERNRIFDIEFDTGVRPCDARLREMYAVQSQGESCWHEPGF